MQTNSVLPVLCFDQVVVERPFRGSASFGNVRVSLPSPVIRSRGNDKEPSTAHPRYDVTVSKDRYPEVFDILESAPLGCHLSITADVFGRGAKVRSGDNEYVNFLGAFEAIDAKNLGFPEIQEKETEDLAANPT